ncbi:hypothetical protein B0A48_15807 [Cryoendolithus antarcticus]|uniref:Uncharacterized protein n=1 Tax=Cryoendolithus antarcticus TaxID=1507870 RepID=A0A1V8SHC9_9PEZI|nr:hypothetical protein B0A48_15807 [Cryoendolithus antarcticus]
MAQVAKPTDKKFDPKSIPNWGTQVPAVTTATSIKDFTDFGRSLADAQDVSSRHNGLLVDGFAQPPFKGAFGEKVPGTGPLPEARVAKGRNYASLVVMRGLGTAKDWVLFDFKRGWPKALKQPPALFVKFQEFRPGNKRVVLFNEGSGNVTLKSTPMCLEGKGVEYTKSGPKIVEAADVQVATGSGGGNVSNPNGAGDPGTLTSGGSTQDGLIEERPKKQSAAALSAARKMAAAMKSDQAPESALRSTLRRAPVEAAGKALSKKPNTIASSKAVATMPTGVESQMATSANTTKTIMTGNQAKNASNTIRNLDAATSNAEDITEPITRSSTSSTDITNRTGSSTAKTASVTSTISESAMSSANAEVSVPKVVRKAATVKARRAKQAVERKEELPTKSSRKRKAEVETPSSDTLELSSSSTAAEERSTTPPTKKQKLTDESAAVIATVEAPVPPISASATGPPASMPTITAPPSPKKRNKHYNVPPRELPAREGRGKNSRLNPAMVGTLESIEPTSRKRKAAAVKPEVVEEPVAKKIKRSAVTAEREGTVAPNDAPVEIERKSSRAVPVAKTVPKQAIKKIAKQSDGLPPQPAMKETSSADMLDAALKIVAAERNAIPATQAEASKKVTKKLTALSATVGPTTEEDSTSAQPAASTNTKKKPVATPALPAATKKSTRKQTALPAAPPSPIKKTARKPVRKEGTTVGVDLVIKGKVSKIRQRAPPKPKQTPVNVVESESGSDEMEL